MSNHNPETPELAPPGAGIPAVERTVGRVILALRRWRGTPEEFSAEFEREREAIAGMYRASDEQALGRRVLIPRLRGLEDSSRFWSVYMTLEHLRIVNDQIARVIGVLIQGVVPEGRASTAAVKPGPGVGAAVVPVYEASCDDLLRVVEKAQLRTKVRYAHPWFGLLDAAGWHSMAAMHMGIHREQIARILDARRTP